MTQITEKNMPEKAQCRKEFFGPCHFEWESKNAHPPSWASSFGQLMKYDRYREALFTPRCWAQVQCNWLTYVMYMYLEPNWPLFLNVFSLQNSLPNFQAKQTARSSKGSGYIHVKLRNFSNYNPLANAPVFLISQCIDWKKNRNFQ